MGHLLIYCSGQHNSKYFRHQHRVDIDPQCNIKSKWHKDWQNRFDIDKQEVQYIFQDKRKFADVKIQQDMIVEFQHSLISRRDVVNRNNFYKQLNIDAIWVIDCEDMQYLNEQSQTATIKNSWKIEHFEGIIYLDYKGNIYQVQSDKMVNKKIVYNKVIQKQDFINMCNDINEYKKLLQLDFKQPPQLICQQFGAGNGKTFISIMIAGQNNNYDDDHTWSKVQQLQEKLKIQNKINIIYLVKMNSAKDVILTEMMYLYNTNKLKLHLPQNIQQIFQQNDIKKLKLGNQYIINLDDNKKIIIATIDSFFFAIYKKHIEVGNYNAESFDFFTDLAKQISEQHDKINFRYKEQQINMQSLIIIDEIQDLDKNYSDAIKRIQQDTQIDLFMNGDYLQSIWKQDNAMNYFPIQSGQNVIRRFKNKNLQHFVNNTIYFDLYNDYKVCQISDIDIENIDGSLPLMFQIPILSNQEKKNGQVNLDKYNNTMNIILDNIKKEVQQNNYKPNDFMIISPIIKDNVFLVLLQIRIQQFWSEFYDDPNENYVIMHHSENNQSINLQESKDATQILSIHSSKGSGRNVVFVLCLDEFSLKLFSKDDDLIYESLLHIAFTRQKYSLYIGYQSDRDNVYHRLQNAKKQQLCEEIYNKDIQPTLQSVNKNISIESLETYISNKYILGDQQVKEKIDNIFEYIGDQLKYDDSAKDKQTIDYAHHQTRFNSMFYQFLRQINKYWRDNKNGMMQLYAQLMQIAQSKIIIVNAENYTDESNKSKHTNRQIKQIALLQFQTQNANDVYSEILSKIIINIQNKINQRNLDNFCQLENLVIMFCIDQQYHGIFARLQIIQLYQTIKVFGQNFADFEQIKMADGVDVKHNNCLCKQLFTNGQNDQNGAYLIQFYDELNSVPTRFSEFIGLAEQLQQDDLFTHNDMHQINLELYGQFKLNSRSDIIGYNKQNVIQHIIKSQYNKLNYYNTLIHLCCQQYLIQNCSGGNNKEKYHNKDIYSGIFTLDNNYKMTNIPNQIIQENLQEIVQEYLQFVYKNQMVHFMHFVQDFIQQKKRQGHQLREIIIDLDIIIRERTNIPVFMKDSFTQIKNETQYKSTESLQKLQQLMQKRFDELFDQKQVDEQNDW